MYSLRQYLEMINTKLDIISNELAIKKTKETIYEDMCPIEESNPFSMANEEAWFFGKPRPHTWEDLLRDINLETDLKNSIKMIKGDK